MIEAVRKNSSLRELESNLLAISEGKENQGKILALLKYFKAQRSQMIETAFSGSNINHKMENFSWRVDYRTKAGSGEDSSTGEYVTLEFRLSNKIQGVSNETFLVSVEKDDFQRIAEKIEGAEKEMNRFLR